MRGDDLPASIRLQIDVSITRLLAPRLAIFLRFLDDAAAQNHHVAINACLHILGEETTRCSARRPRPADHCHELRLRLHLAVRKGDHEVVAHDAIHRLRIELLVGIEPCAFELPDFLFGFRASR